MKIKITGEYFNGTKHIPLGTEMVVTNDLGNFLIKEGKAEEVGRVSIKDELVVKPEVKEKRKKIKDGNDITTDNNRERVDSDNDSSSSWGGSVS